MFDGGRTVRVSSDELCCSESIRRVDLFLTRPGRVRGQSCSSIQALSEVKDKNRCYQPSILLLLLAKEGRPACVCWCLVLLMGSSQEQTPTYVTSHLPDDRLREKKPT